MLLYGYVKIIFNANFFDKFEANISLIVNDFKNLNKHATN